MPLFHPEVDILRYREGDLDEEEKRSVDKHIQGCADCREYLAFVDDFQAGLQELTPEELAGTQTCPEPELIYNYEQGTLDEKSARQLRAHMLFCDACTDELYALRRLRHPRSFTQAVIRIAKKAAKKVLQVLDISGTGELLELAPGVSRSDEEGSREDVQIEDTVADPETKQSSAIRIQIDADPKGTGARMRLQADPPQPDWKVSLALVDGEELMAVPIAERETPLGSDVAPGSYVVNIRKGENSLASFALEVQAAA
ncbi:MAG: hypothetical protein DMG72_00845 [Acidobacteria bacterium]|nr:MAG: hypothetical protein DMG72_00845 [Acidobacteriota bacterium]